LPAPLPDGKETAQIVQAFVEASSKDGLSKPSDIS